MTNQDWLQGLPDECRDATVPPVAIDRHSDELAHAERMKGYDALGKLCYYRHAYAIRNERFDDEGLYDESESYREEVTGWRLYTGGWLVRSYTGSEQGHCAGRLVKAKYRLCGVSPADHRHPGGPPGMEVEIG